MRNGLDFCGGRGEVVMRKAYVVLNVCRQCVEMRKVDWWMVLEARGRHGPFWGTSCTKVLG